MKINVISDIHATIDVNGNVLYNYPIPYSQKKYENTIKVLKTYFTDAKDTLKDTMTFKYDYLHNTFPETIVIKSYADLEKYIDILEQKVQTKFENTSNEQMFELSRAIGCIQTLIKENDLEAFWHYKQKVLPLEKVKDFMFKCIYSFEPEKLEPADYLIIAGDLAIEPLYNLVLKDIEEKTAGKFKKILHIAGNHDHWWFKISGISEVKPDHVNLEHDYFEYVDGEYAFVGCTLWTPIPESYVWSVGRYMNDYNYIPGRFSPYASNNQYKIQSEWLKSKLAKYSDKKVIVFTHHQPFEELTFEDYKHNGHGWETDVNAAYVVLDHSLDNVNKYNNIVLWACGHTHQNFDDIIHNVHIVRNPIGYRDVTDSSYICPENPSRTWYNKIIEV